MVRICGSGALCRISPTAMAITIRRKFKAKYQS